MFWFSLRDEMETGISAYAGVTVYLQYLRTICCGGFCCVRFLKTKQAPFFVPECCNKKSVCKNRFFLFFCFFDVEMLNHEIIQA